MRQILHRALTATADLWPSLYLVFGWITLFVCLLDNPAQQAGAVIQAHYQRLLEQFRAFCATAPGEPIQTLGEHFLKITQSYWAGLFHGYDLPGLPRTNNDLEQFFGRLRHQERRITGRKRAPPSLIIRGAVRVVAAVVSWADPVDAQRLAGVDIQVWREERRRLGRPRQARILQRHFRQNPDLFLADLEARLVKLVLPP
jgi:hypothetical protein